MNPQVWSMDSPVISRLFRQLFTHRSCQSVRSHSSLPFRIHNGRRTGVRYSSSKGDGGEKPKQDSLWQPRRDAFPEDMSAEYEKYPMVTADQLRGRRERPRRVKMLTRDFIEGMSTTSGSLPGLHSSRFIIQSLIWLLLETSSNLYSRRAFQFQPNARRARISPVAWETIHGI
jgi:hypothetical protein